MLNIDGVIAYNGLSFLLRSTSKRHYYTAAVTLSMMASIYHASIDECIKRILLVKIFGAIFFS
jgi:hypothetical protein